MHNKYFYHLRVLFNFCFTPVSSWISITQLRESYRSIMDDIGADLKNTIVNQLSAGRQFRVCQFWRHGLLGAGEHYLEQPSKFRQALDSTIYLTFDKVSCQGLDNKSDLRAFDDINYLLSKDELETIVAYLFHCLYWLHRFYWSSLTLWSHLKKLCLLI